MRLKNRFPELLSPLEIHRNLEIFTPWYNRIQAGITTGQRLDGTEASLAFPANQSGYSPLEARRDFCAALDLEPEQFCCLNQCHSTRVIKAENRGMGSFSNESTLGADSLITGTTGLCLSVFSADCVPLLFYDPETHCAAAVHGGWKGTHGKIALRTIEAMEQEWGCQPGDIRVYIGPSIGDCCYRVGTEVADLFRDRFSFNKEILFEKSDGVYLDLKGTHRRTLLAGGIEKKHIQVSSECTLCGTGPYPSYRKSGASAGRFSAFICLK